MRRCKCFIHRRAVITAFWMAALFVSAASSQTITKFDVPNASATIPTAINASGHIAGYYFGQGYAGFARQRDGSIATFAAGSATFPTAISPAGDITGYYWESVSGAPSPQHGFVRPPDGSILPFDPPNSVLTQPVDINVARQVTGFYLTADGIAHGFLREGNGAIATFDVPGAQSTVPLAISPSGEITGIYGEGLLAEYITLGPPNKTYSSSGHAFVRRRDGSLSLFDVPETLGGTGSGTTPLTINAKGDVAGTYNARRTGTEAGGVHAFVRKAGGSYSEIRMPEGYQFYPFPVVPQSIMPSGAVIGSFWSGFFPQGFIRGPDASVQVFMVEGSWSTRVTAGNAAGWVAGCSEGSVPFVPGTHAFVRTPN